MEDVGPITLGQASEFLRHCHVTIKPVIDLAEDRPVDGFAVPDRLREQLHLRQPASAFPWSSAISRQMDADHTIPYGRGPTAIANLGKLTRFEHRVKTHAPGWRHRQPQPGVHEWRTPTGYQFTVDHTGTHPRRVVSTGSTTRFIVDHTGTHPRDVVSTSSTTGPVGSTTRPIGSTTPGLTRDTWSRQARPPAHRIAPSPP